MQYDTPLIPEATAAMPRSAPAGGPAPEPSGVVTDATESSYRAIFQHSSAAIWVHDLETGALLDVNPAGCEMFGYTLEEMMRLGHDVLLYPGSPYTAERVAEHMARAAAGATPRFEWLGRHRDGSAVWGDITLRRVSIGVEERILAAVRDITEQKQAEDALVASEENYRTLFDLAGDALFVHDPETGAILDANRFACEIYGCSLAELKQRGLDLIGGARAPFTRERALEYIRLAAAGEPQRFEWLVDGAGGEAIWSEVSLNRISVRGRDRVIASLRDIRERKAAEAALLRAEENAQLTASRMRAVAGAAAGVIGAESIDTLLPVLRDACRQVISIDAFWLALYDEPRHTLTYAGYDLDGFVPARSLPAAGTPSERVLRGRTSILTHRSTDPETEGAVRLGTGRRSESIIRTPILSGSRVLGVLSVQSYTPGLYTGQDVEVLEAIAALAATALLNIELLAELRASEESYRTIFEASGDAIYVLDCDTGAILDVNRAACELNGYPPEEMKALGIGGLSYDRAPYDWETAQALIRRAAAGEPQRIDWLARHRSGRDVWGEVTLQRVTIRGEDRVLATARDVTERRAVDEQLRRLNEELEQRVAERTGELQERESRFRRLTENSSDLVQIIYADGTMGYTGPSVTHLLGYTPEEIAGRSILKFIHPDDREAAQEALLAVLTAPGTSRSLRYRVRHRDGRWRMFEAYGRTLLPDSAVEGLVCNARDITERYEAEQALRASESRYRSLIENAHDIVTILDVEGVITYQSPQLERVLGYAPGETIGRSALEFVHPDDRHLPQQALQRILAAPGTTYFSEYRFRHKDGSWRYLETFGRTLVPESPERGLVFNTRDVTERRQVQQALREREEHFRRLIETSHDLIQTLDSQGRIVYSGPSVERLLGYTPDEIAGGDASRFIHPDDQPMIRERIVDALHHPGQMLHAEYRVLHKDGRWRWFEALARTLATDSAEQGLVANARDVTERKQAEEALARAKEEADRAREVAERANRAKSEFLSRMSHELRTPMNSILGFAQLLDRAALPPEHKKGVGHILKAGRHLLQLINEVLEIARIEAGRHSLSLEPVRVGTVLQEAVGLVRPLAAQWRVELDDGPWPCCAAYVHADRQRLTQVLLNLLANAIKYNRPGGRVRIECESLAAAGERPRLVVRVEDTGYGVDPERADQLFTPFARLGAEQSEVEGTGLGLALSQRLTEAMGGSLALERTGPEGSVFRLELLPAADPLQRLEEAAAPPAADGDAPHAPATLLYVEDNLANLSLVETILLARPRWRTLPALQGQLGLELAREHVPDLVLLDLHLPDLSGEEVLRRLRAEPRTAAVPVVVISADATRGTVERLRAAGADAYLTKPLDVDEFLDTVERFLPSPE